MHDILLVVELEYCLPVQLHLSVNGKALVCATSWWNTTEISQYLEAKEKPIWINLSANRTELYREITNVYCGHSPDLERCAPAFRQVLLPLRSAVESLINANQEAGVPSRQSMRLREGTGCLPLNHHASILHFFPSQGAIIPWRAALSNSSKRHSCIV